MLDFSRKCMLVFIIMIFTASLALSSDNDIIPDNISVFFNGKFIHYSYNTDSNIHSNNGHFWCRYDIGNVGDEVRQLQNFQLYENDQLLFTLKQAPGSDIYISNSGIIAFFDHTHHYRQELTIHFYSKYGQRLFSETFTGASLFGFSSTGNKFGVGTGTHLHVISVLNHHIDTYEKGFQFDICEAENVIAAASENKVRLYSGGQLQREITTDLFHTRKIKISSRYNLLAVIDKHHLKVYSLSDGSLLFADTISGELSYRDLVLDEGKILAGIHYRDSELSKGIIKIFDCSGKILLEKEELVKNIKSVGEYKPPDNPLTTYVEIPWPFVPFDSMHTVWNYYEQHMGGYGPDWSYLHQGLDIIVPVDEPTYAVAGGIVKCVLTLGGDIYWRTAISPEQSAGWSTGWLYAHLVESSIQFDVGDTVQIHDYLGDIIHWHDNWGHIHFVEIRDSGLVWDYFDNEWGITYNPLLSLIPDTDSIPPVIDYVFGYSKFAFCTNETSNYLDPDSLYGDIDIITKVVDYIGDSPWEQPAFELYYWITIIPQGDTIFPRTLGQILNHPYDFYASDHYEPYATLLYKRDELLEPSSWMDLHRNYYHILTNNNGDSIAELSEKQLAFSTADYYDGDYRIFVEAFDEYGNSVIDSQDVQFKNGNVGIIDTGDSRPSNYQLGQNYPNPFNSSTKISYSIPEAGFVSLKVYDILGREIKALVNEYQDAGTYSIDYKTANITNGIYLYKLHSGNYVETKRLLFLK